MIAPGCCAYITIGSLGFGTVLEVLVYCCWVQFFFHSGFGTTMLEFLVFVSTFVFRVAALGKVFICAALFSTSHKA